MSVTFDVIEDGFAVVVRFSDPWEAYEMDPVMKQDKAHRDSIQNQYPGRRVHIIADFSGSKELAHGAFRARNSPSITHPTKGIAIVVGANSMVQAASRMVLKLAGNDDLQFAATYDEAVQIITLAIKKETAG